MFWESFIAFNANAFSNLCYEITSNWCFVVILVAMIITIILSLRTEVDAVVPEEQNVL